MQKDSTEIYFPNEPGLDSKDMKKMKWFMYGPPGVGKSTFMAQAKDVLFLTTDGGHDFINSMNRPIENWFMFKKYVKAIKTDLPDQYKAIAFDVVDAFWKMCRKSVCDKRGIEHPSDEQWGKGYDLVASEFELPFLELISLKKYGLFFLSHSEDIEKKTRLSTVTKTVPKLKKAALDILMPMMDIVSFYGLDGAVDDDGKAIRRMYFQPTESMEAKDRTKLLPESIKIPDPDKSNGFDLVQEYLVRGGPPPKSPKKILVRKK